MRDPGPQERLKRWSDSDAQAFLEGQHGRVRGKISLSVNKPETRSPEPWSDLVHATGPLSDRLKSSSPALTAGLIPYSGGSSILATGTGLARDEVGIHPQPGEESCEKASGSQSRLRVIGRSVSNFAVAVLVRNGGESSLYLLCLCLFFECLFLAKLTCRQPNVGTYIFI